jgi:hypothetical protein
MWSLEHPCGRRRATAVAHGREWRRRRNPRSRRGPARARDWPRWRGAAAEAEDQRRGRARARTRGRSPKAERGRRTGAGVAAGSSGSNRYERPPTDMTGRIHASVEHRMNQRWKNRNVGRIVGAPELRGETRHRMVRRPIFIMRRSSCARV